LSNPYPWLRRNCCANIMRSSRRPERSAAIKSVVRLDMTFWRSCVVLEISNNAFGSLVNDVPNNSQLMMVSSSPDKSRPRISRSCLAIQSGQVFCTDPEDFNSAGSLFSKKRKTWSTSSKVANELAANASIQRQAKKAARRIEKLSHLYMRLQFRRLLYAGR